MPTRPTRVAVLALPLTLAMLGPLVLPAQAATSPVLVTQLLPAGTAQPHTWRQVESAFAVDSSISTGAVGAAGQDPTKLNGSLMAATGDDAGAEYWFVDATTPPGRAPSLADFVGTNPATTPRAQFYSPTGEGIANVYLWVRCDSASAPDLVFPGNPTPTNTWTTHAWPTIHDNTRSIGSRSIDASTMAEFDAACPDATVAGVQVSGLAHGASPVYLDNVSFQGREYDFGVSAPGVTAPVTTLTAGQSVTVGTTTLAMQPDGNAVIYQSGQPVFWTGTFVPGSTLKVQPDGNIVLYNPNGDWLWQSGSYGNPGATAALSSAGLVLTRSGGATLWDSTKNSGVRRYVQTVPSMASGARTSSLSTRYRLDMQPDGNLVLWDLRAVPVAKPVWNSGTWGHPGSYLVVQADGNLVIWDPVARKATWNTGTWGNPSPSLNLQDDGNLVLYSGVTPTWWTKR